MGRADCFRLRRTCANGSRMGILAHHVGDTGPLYAVSGMKLDIFGAIDVDCMVPLHLGMVFS